MRRKSDSGGRLANRLRDLDHQGREDALMHWCMTHQIKARELNLVGREDEDD
jgi:hypothetical protein